MAGGGYVVIALCFAFAGGLVGKLKGSSFFIWFVISGLVPVIGLLTALLYRWDSEELRRECPRCGKLLKLHDAICTRCGMELEFPEEAVVSKAAERRLRAG
jgi:ribosomal protein S27AE